MSDRTPSGPHSDTKITKVTKTTNAYFVFVIFVSFVIFVLESRPWPVSATAQQTAPPTQAQQRPVFRGGTHFVRVDAYPVRDGKIIDGLTPEDFEILEDGKPQAIESFDFIRFDTFTPEAERRNPSSQREGFEMAKDPRYRVFVIFVDMAFSYSKAIIETMNDMGRIQQPLVNFIDRVIGAHDLFGLLSSRNTVKDLVLGQKTTMTAEQVKDLWRAQTIDYDPTQRFDPAYDPFLQCLKCREPRPGERDHRSCKILRDALTARYHADQTYTELRELIALLGAIREERKSIVFVSNLLGRWREDQSLFDRLHPGTPEAGIDKGRPGFGDPHETTVTDYTCAADVNRLPLMDFENRYQQVLTEARRANVAFYPITPSGLQAANLWDRPILEAENNDLRLLAQETGGIAVVDSNDLDAGMRRIADDMQAYYVLGYYTTNTKFDGKIRKISVRLKANGLKAGETIRARREYRAPTQAEIAALANPPAAPPADTGPPAVIGEPIAYRVSRAEGVQKVSRLEFVRADRLRVEWPVLAPLDRRDARMLDSADKPMPFDLPVSEAERKAVLVELPLAAFGRGVYAIELTAASGGKTERRRLTFMMK
jgi:VWFA-related protein